MKISQIPDFETPLVGLRIIPEPCQEIASGNRIPFIAPVERKTRQIGVAGAEKLDHQFGNGDGNRFDFHGARKLRRNQVETGHGGASDIHHIQCAVHNDRSRGDRRRHLHEVAFNGVLLDAFALGFRNRDHIVRLHIGKLLAATDRLQKLGRNLALRFTEIDIKMSSADRSHIADFAFKQMSPADPSDRRFILDIVEFARAVFGKAFQKIIRHFIAEAAYHQSRAAAFKRHGKISSFFLTGFKFALLI